MTKPTEYEIGNVLDFLNVPPHRLNFCLHEFGQWLVAMREVPAIFGGLVEPMAPFVWVDDDLGKMDMTLQSIDGEIFATAELSLVKP